MNRCAKLVRGLLRCGPLLAALAAQSAFAAFDPPVMISPAGEEAARARVAVNAAGEGIVVWYRFDGTPQRVYARRRSAAGVLGPILALSGGSAGSRYPDVAIDTQGDAFVVWQSGDSDARIQGRSVSRTGALGPLHTLSAPHQALFPQVAVDDDGDALVVWANGGTVQARAVSKANVVGPIQNIAGAGASAVLPDVAVDAQGDGVIVWEGSAGGVWIAGRTRSRTGALGTPFVVSPAGYTVHEPKVLMHRDGRALFSWVIVPQESQPSWVQARRMNAGGSLGPIETLTIHDGVEHAAAVNTAFDAMIVWRADRIRARSLSRVGVQGPLLTISSTADFPDVPKVVLRRNGGALFVWEQPSAGGVGLIRQRTLSPTGVLGPVGSLTGRGQENDPQIAIDGTDDALVVWDAIQQAGGSRIQARAEQ